MRPYTEADRYIYPLTAESIVLDVGAYLGEFAITIHRKYGCRVVCFEPVREFWEKLLLNTGVTGIRCYQCGVGSTARDEQFGVQNNSTGLYADSRKKETVTIISIEQALALATGNGKAVPTIDKPRREVALLKLNCEGMEFEILEKLIETGLIRQVRNIAVQFHWNADNAKARHEALHARLLETHNHDWGTDPSFWIGYSLKL